MNGLPEHAAAFVEGYTHGCGLQPETAARVDDWQVYYMMNWAAFYQRQARTEGAAELLATARSACFSR